MENIPDDEAARKEIELEEIGIGRKNRNENQLFGGSNLNNQLALKFQQQANLRAAMVSYKLRWHCLDWRAVGARKEKAVPQHEFRDAAHGQTAKVEQNDPSHRYEETEV